jgi:hypothetical protein
LAIAIVVVVAALLLPPYELLPSLAARTGLLGVYALGVWFGILTDGDKQFVFRMLRDYRNLFPTRQDR